MTGFYSKKIKDVRERADNLFGTILNLPRHLSLTLPDPNAKDPSA
jgi:hypothetical protein